MNNKKYDPYQAGYCAAYQDTSAMDNPYDMEIDHDSHFDWHDGLMEGCHDIWKRQQRKERWEERRAHLKGRLIQCLYSMAFVAVCYIIGTSLRYLLR